MGNRFLKGGDEAVYNNTALENDLVSAGFSKDNDPFTKVVINNAIVLWHTIIGKRIKQSSEGVITYSEKWLLVFLRFLSTVVASMLPVAAVFALQGITPKPERYRLGAFAAFTFVFVVLMGLFTGAKRSEIFAAAAASVPIPIVLPSKYCVRLGSLLILLSSTVLRDVKSYQPPRLEPRTALKICPTHSSVHTGFLANFASCADLPPFKSFSSVRTTTIQLEQ
jgi:hypothetical protein